MKRTRLRALIAAPAAVLLATFMAGAASAGPAAAAANLLANPGFETGTLSGWTCSATDHVTASPVHSGSGALAGAASASDDAQCSVSLSWTAPAGTVTGYNVYQNGTKAASVTGTSATVSGLAAATAYSFTVTAYNAAGESAASGAVRATTASSGSGGGGGGSPGSYAVAPYADMTNNQEPMLNQAASQADLKAFTAAFVIGSGCTPIWGDTLPVTNDPTVTSEITTAEADGAQPIVSFGGESGSELAASCSSLASSPRRTSR